MGMDVYGKSPAAEEGKYFRNNWWWWRPLADYCLEVAPKVCAPCVHWHTNDGDGLDAEGAARLAAALRAEIASGRTASYARAYEAKQEMTPNEACDLCDGTGTRKPIPERGAGDPKTTGVKCNACEGAGYVRPFSTAYPFSVDNVAEFAAFLEKCGGFELC